VHPFPLSNLEIVVIRTGGYIFVTGKSRIMSCDHIIQNQDFSMCDLKTVTFGAIVFLAEHFLVVCILSLNSRQKNCFFQAGADEFFGA
jgi:hypothetical protein